MNPHMLPGEFEAYFCRRMGYGPGTRLAGDEGYGVTIIRLTAIGERCILAIRVLHNSKPSDGFENTWTLAYRDWRAV